MSASSTKSTTCEEAGLSTSPSSSAGEIKRASDKSLATAAAAAAAPPPSTHMQILDELEDKARRCCGDGPKEWTLADDARLATFVQEFTAHIQRRAESIADSVVALENKKDKAATKVELAKSAFLRLSDQRYVDQVVVDGTGDGVSCGAAEPSQQGDGGTSKEEHDTADISGQDAINQQQTVENQAIRDGMKASELFYDPAHATGSEDHYFGLDQGDDSAWYYESAPADTFNQRPLPYVVGSREFMESTDAGLGEEYGAEEDEDDGVDGATDGSQVGTGGVE